MLEGRRVKLAPLDVSDITSDYVNWLNDPATFEFLGSKFPQTVTSVRRYVESLSHPNFISRIIRCEDDVHVGNIAMNGFSTVNRRMELGIMIGDPSARGKGLGREACSLAIEHVFDHLNVHKVTAGTVVDNAGMTHVFQALGFVIEGTLREHYALRGGYRDYHVFGLLREQFVPCHR